MALVRMHLAWSQYKENAKEINRMQRTKTLEAWKLNAYPMKIV